MLYVKDRQSLNVQFGALTALVFHTIVFLALMPSCRGQSAVIGPSQPIVALAGDDIILPCHLDPSMNAVDMTMEWARADLEPRFVLVWRDGVELKSKKHPSYRGRTSLLTEELKHGDVSLRLSKVKRSDEGTYRCFIPDLDRAAAVQLVVGAVSSPVIQMSKNISGVLLQCESEGWYPEPEVLWLDAEGNVLPSEPTETVRGPDDLYTVSSRVTVEKRHSSSITCRVQQKNTNQTRETHVQVPDQFFMVPSTPNTPSSSGSPSSPHVIIGSVIGCAALVLIPAVVVVVQKWRQKKFKNKRMSPEDGREQTEEEKTVTTKDDNTECQVVLEEEGENAPLMARREEENNVDSRGDEAIRSQREHKDETCQVQLMTKPDVDKAEGEREMKSMKNEKVPLIFTEGEIQQKQDIAGRQVLNDGEEGEGEQTMSPEGEDSGLLLVLMAEGQKEQQQNVQTDQELKKEEETHQEPDEGKKEANIKKKRAIKKSEQERDKKGGPGSTGWKTQQENQREQMQQKAVRMKFQSETWERNVRERDEIELKPQRGNNSQHLLQDRKQEGSEAEHDDQKGKVQEGNQSDVKRMTEGKADNQMEQSNAKLRKREEDKVENERRLQSERQEKIKRAKERTELQRQEGDGNLQVLDASKQKAEHEDEKGKDQEGDQSNISPMTERKAENQKRQISEKPEKTEASSVSEEVTEKQDLKIHEETAGRKNQELQQENELQAEKQREEKPERNQEETKDQPERWTNGVKVECKERQQENVEIGKVAEISETQKKSKEIRQEGQQLAVQQQDEKEEIREHIEESSERHAQRGTECEEVQQEETKENDRRVHVHQQQTVRKRKHQEEDSETTQETFKRPKEEQNEDQMEVEVEANIRQEVIDEPQEMEVQQQDQVGCLGDQQQETMEF